MQMQQLRYFLAVVEHGGFTRAAEQLGRTQQAVSKALRLLEADLGVRLLDREAGAPRPTAFGLMLLEFARRVTRDEGEFRARLQQVRSASRGEVRIGTSASRSSTGTAAFFRVAVRARADAARRLVVLRATAALATVRRAATTLRAATVRVDFFAFTFAAAGLAVALRPATAFRAPAFLVAAINPSPSCLSMFRFRNARHRIIIVAPDRHCVL